MIVVLINYLSVAVPCNGLTFLLYGVFIEPIYTHIICSPLCQRLTLYGVSALVHTVWRVLSILGVLIKLALSFCIRNLDLNEHELFLYSCAMDLYYYSASRSACVLFMLLLHLTEVAFIWDRQEDCVFFEGIPPELPNLQPMKDSKLSTDRATKSLCNPTCQAKNSASKKSNAQLHASPSPLSPSNKKPRSIIMEERPLSSKATSNCDFIVISREELKQSDMTTNKEVAKPLATSPVKNRKNVRVEMESSESSGFPSSSLNTTASRVSPAHLVAVVEMQSIANESVSGADTKGIPKQCLGICAPPNELSIASDKQVACAQNPAAVEPLLVIKKSPRNLVTNLGLMTLMTRVRQIMGLALPEKEAHEWYVKDKSQFTAINPAKYNRWVHKKPQISLENIRKYPRTTYEAARMVHQLRNLLQALLRYVRDGPKIIKDLQVQIVELQNYSIKVREAERSTVANLYLRLYHSKTSNRPQSNDRGSDAARNTRDKALDAVENTVSLYMGPTARLNNWHRCLENMLDDMERRLPRFLEDQGPVQPIITRVERRLSLPNENAENYLKSYVKYLRCAIKHIESYRKDFDFLMFMVQKLATEENAKFEAWKTQNAIWRLAADCCPPSLLAD